MNVNISTNDSLIRIHGADATKFLQGQLTCDVEQIKDNEWSLGAHCNPKGRVMSLFRISHINNDYYLILPRSMVSLAISALQKYAVFFKVKIEEYTDFAIINANIIEDATYKLEQINRGIPDIYPETSGKYLPHELNLPQLGGVSFEKGCYTGQEIISRMHYLGKLKKSLRQTRIAEESLTRGEDYVADGTLIGSIVDYCQTGYNESIALVLTSDESV